MARPAIKIEASKGDRETLLKWRRSPTTPQKLVHRAEIILAAAEGLSNKSISRRGVRFSTDNLPVAETIC
jgi:hypothetical protein